MTIQLALQGEVHRLPGRLVDYRVMPSVRVDALYDGLKALDCKWWSAELRGEAKIRVRLCASASTIASRPLMQ